MNPLSNLGLDDNEAKIYQALLELGPATVTQITKKAGITRTFGYEILKELSLQGLVSQVSGAGKKFHYTVEHPRRLVQFVKNKKNSWERRLASAARILPELVSLYKVAEKPTVKFQEGTEGVKAIFSETLETKEEILSILDIEGWDVPEFRQWGKEYNRERSRRRIHERILMLDTPAGREWMKYYAGSMKYTDYRWIKPEQLPGTGSFGGEINIYENKVVMALLKKPHRMGVMIESPVLANVLKSLFELAWTQGIPSKRKRGDSHTRSIRS